MFHTFFSIAFLVLLARFVVPLPWPVVCRMALAIALLVITKHHWLQEQMFGTMFSPELPRYVVLGFGFLLFAAVILLVLTVMLDAAWLVIFAARKGIGVAKSTKTKCRYAAASAALVLSAVGVINAIQVPNVRHLEITIQDLPTALDGFKLVQLTDLHIHRVFDRSWVEEVVHRTNALSPDLIVVTGDLIDGTPEARAHDVAPLRNLRARMGVITSLGNHEYYFDANRWSAEFERLGMKVLENGHTSVRSGDAELFVAAVTDPAAASFGKAPPDLGLALQGIPVDTAVILLSHRPDAVLLAGTDVDLQLSGHTHGGLIWGFDRIVEAANDGFVSGLYSFAKTQVYVSNGTALWNGFPIRLGVPPEIAEITLRAPTN